MLGGMSGRGQAFGPRRSQGNNEGVPEKFSEQLSETDTGLTKELHCGIGCCIIAFIYACITSMRHHSIAMTKAPDSLL